MNQKRNYIVDLLVMVFGVSAWIGVTGIYLESPQFIQNAPEGWKLPSIIGLLVQSGNIASVFYIIYLKWSPKKVDDMYIIYLTLGIACLAALLMVFFYSNTITVGDNQISIPLFVFTIMFAIVGCISSVLFMPYMARFRDIYLVTFFIGQGLNGLLSSFVSIVQGIGIPQCNNQSTTHDAIINATNITYTTMPLFQPNVYFLFTFLTLVLSLIAFTLMNRTDVCKREYATMAFDASESSPLEHDFQNLNRYHSIATHISYLSSGHFTYLMIILGVTSFFIYGLFPGIEPYSSLPYGPSAYFLSAICQSVATTIAYFISWFIARPTVRTITILFGITSTLSVFILLTVAQSPTPLFHTSAIGIYLIILVWTMFNGFTTFIKVSIMQWFRCYGENALKWGGAVTQFSSCFGAIIVFLLVNQTSIFPKNDPCLWH